MYDIKDEDVDAVTDQSNTLKQQLPIVELLKVQTTLPIWPSFCSSSFCCMPAALIAQSFVYAFTSSYLLFLNDGNH